MQFTSDDNFAAASERIEVAAGFGVQLSPTDIMSDELLARLDEKIKSSRLLTESAIKVTKSYDRRASIRKVPRFLGKAAYAVLTGSIVTAAVFQSGEIEQFKAMSELLNFTDLATDLAKNIVNGDFKEYLNGLWDKVSNNGLGYAKYGAFQFALAEAKGVWDNVSNDVLGAYASGVVKLEDKTLLQSATVIAAYERLGVPLTLGGDVRDIDEIKKDISELVERVDYMSKSELAHFMRATGIINSDTYCLAMTNSITEKVRRGEMDQVSATVAVLASARANELAASLVQMYETDALCRQFTPTIERIAGKVLFTEDEFNKVGELLKKAGVIDDGGVVKVNQKLGVRNAHSLLLEHLLSTLETGDPKAISEIRGTMKCLESALASVGIKSVADIYAVSTKSFSDLSLSQWALGKRVINNTGAINVEGVIKASESIREGVAALKNNQSTRPRNGLR